jgi:DNA-binding LacI/PurR family transcriptional regulator
MTEIDKTIPLPLYYQLTESLRKSIKNDWTPGKKFHSERYIANQCSVSRITVGRVLNDLVKEGLLHRIQGKGTFVSNISSKKDKQAHQYPATNNVGFIVTKRLTKIFSGVHNPEELAMLRSYLEDYGYHLIFCYSDNNISNNRKLNDMTKKLDAMIIEGEVSAELINFFDNKIPIVLIDHCIDGITSVIADNVKGVTASTEYLIKSGRKKIGIIYGSQMCVAFKERFEAAKETIIKNNLHFYPEFTAEATGLLSEGYSAAIKILSGKDYPDAIICANDVIAIGATKAIHDSGLKLPEDIAVMGFDNTEMSEYVYPQLSTVDYDRSKLLQVVTEIINKKIIGRYDDKEKVILPVKLLIRESC